MGDQEDKELDKLSEQKDQKKTGDDDMAVIEKELKDMQKLQKKGLTMEELKRAMMKQTIEKNREALQRLSRT